MLPEYRLKHTKRKSREEKRERNKRALKARVNSVRDYIERWNVCVRARVEDAPRLYLGARLLPRARAHDVQIGFARDDREPKKNVVRVFPIESNSNFQRERTRERRTKKRRNSPTATREPERK